MTIKSDAVEFGTYSKYGGWRLGLLVARNVELGTGQGARRPPQPRRGRAKVSAREFAQEAGTTKDRVVRHLTAWDRAARAGLVPHASTLHPGSEVELPDDEHDPWGRYYDGRNALARIYDNPYRLRDDEPDRAKQDPVAYQLQTRGAADVVRALPLELQAQLSEALDARMKLTVVPSAGPPIKCDDHRLVANTLLLRLQQLDERARFIIRELGSGELELLDRDDQGRVHKLTARVRSRMDRVDIFADGLVDVAALRTWLDGDDQLQDDGSDGHGA